jgi:hypothetical protein
MDFKWRSCLPVERGRSFAEFALRVLLEGLRMTYSDQDDMLGSG